MARCCILSGVDETVRYTYRLRPGAQAERALNDEWGRCRWLWNEAVHQRKTGRKPTFCKLSKLLTDTRAHNQWLRDGSQVAQRQTPRTYARALAYSYTVKGRGCPKPKRLKDSRPSLEYTRRGFAIKQGRLCLAGGITVPVVWSCGAVRQAARLHKKAARQATHDARVWARNVAEHHQLIAVEDFHPKFLAKTTMARKAAAAAIGTTKRILIEYGKRAGRKVVLVPPAYTTMTCARCGTRAKERLGLGQRVFRCDRRGNVDGRDRNAARTILAVAERGHAGADDIRHSIPSPQSGRSGAVRARNPLPSGMGKR
jgi:transposase